MLLFQKVEIKPEVPKAQPTTAVKSNRGRRTRGRGRNTRQNKTTQQESTPEPEKTKTGPIVPYFRVYLSTNEAGTQANEVYIVVRFTDLDTLDISSSISSSGDVQVNAGNYKLSVFYYTSLIKA